MIARLIPLEALRGERHFRWRGGDVSRVEALTDAAFALALTLLSLSSQVPESYDELVLLLRGLPAFAACFALFVLLWYYHFQFHRRFGLENLYTIFLNVCLLFLVLVYVYPAKFLFAALADSFLFGEKRFVPGEMMLFYSGGVVGIFTLYALMYVHAYQHREVLGLNEVEVSTTRGSIREHLTYAGVGLASLVLALFGLSALSALIYLLVGPLQVLNAWQAGRVRRESLAT